MIKRLRGKISLLLSFLIGVIFVGIMIELCWLNYKSCLYEMRMSVHAEIREIGWRSFLLQEDEDAILDDMDYAIVHVDSGDKPEVLSNQFDGKTDSELIVYAEKILQNKKNKNLLGETNFSYTHIRKYYKKRGKYFVIIGVRQALQETMPFIYSAVVIIVLGTIVLTIASGRLSLWLVSPVEQSIIAEKQFISNVSHEFKTPLTVIKTNLVLLSDEIGDNKHLDFIKKETEQMTEMINRMLTLLKLEVPVQEGELKWFQADDALLGVIYPMESATFEKKIRMELQIENNMSFHGNEEQIKNLMSILLDNAITYTSEGGSIKIQSFLKAHTFHLNVTNTGDPIPEKDRERLFERFYRQNEHTDVGDGHFGLGLSIAKSIVLNHHGTIRVTSENGQNCFKVSLPVR